MSVTDLDKLGALGSLTNEVDAENGPTPEQAEAIQAEASAEAQAKAWAVIPMTVGKVLSMFAPELQLVYTAEACKEWGEAMVPVAEKYGWNGPSNLPELGLIISTASLALPTVVVVKMKIQAMREAAETGARKQANAAAAANATDVVARDVSLTEGAAGGGAKDGG